MGREGFGAGLGFNPEAIVVSVWYLFCESKRSGVCDGG